MGSWLWGFLYKTCWAPPPFYIWIMHEVTTYLKTISYVGSLCIFDSFKETIFFYNTKTLASRVLPSLWEINRKTLLSSSKVKYYWCSRVNSFCIIRVRRLLMFMNFIAILCNRECSLWLWEECVKWVEHHCPDTPSQIKENSANWTNGLDDKQKDGLSHVSMSIVSSF